jgi:hypothetical protein
VPERQEGLSLAAFHGNPTATLKRGRAELVNAVLASGPGAFPIRRSSATCQVVVELPQASDRNAGDRKEIRRRNGRISADPDDFCAQINQIGCALADDRGSAACRPDRRLWCSLPMVLLPGCVMTLSAGQAAQNAHRRGQAEYRKMTFLFSGAQGPYSLSQGRQSGCRDARRGCRGPGGRYGVPSVRRAISVTWLPDKFLATTTSSCAPSAAGIST